MSSSPSSLLSSMMRLVSLPAIEYRQELSVCTITHISRSKPNPAAAKVALFPSRDFMVLSSHDPASTSLRATPHNAVAESSKSIDIAAKDKTREVLLPILGVVPKDLLRNMLLEPLAFNHACASLIVSTKAIVEVLKLHFYPVPPARGLPPFT